MLAPILHIVLFLAATAEQNWATT